MTAGELRACAYAAGAGVVGMLILPRTKGAQLTPACLVTFTAFGHHKRRNRWADISGINVRRIAGVRRVSVLLVTGERLTLTAPMSFLE